MADPRRRDRRGADRLRARYGRSDAERPDQGLRNNVQRGVRNAEKDLEPVAEPGDAALRIPRRDPRL